jgi:hypothetical protein
MPEHAISVFFTGNMATLGHFFQKNPLYELQPFFFWSSLCHKKKTQHPTWNKLWSKPLKMSSVYLAQYTNWCKTKTNPTQYELISFVELIL